MDAVLGASSIKGFQSTLFTYHSPQSCHSTLRFSCSARLEVTSSSTVITASSITSIASITTSISPVHRFSDQHTTQQTSTQPQRRTTTGTKTVLLRRRLLISSISAAVPLLRIASVLGPAVALLLTVGRLTVTLLLAIRRLLAVRRLLTVTPLLSVRRLLRLIVPAAAQLRQEAPDAAFLRGVSGRKLLLVVALLLPLPIRRTLRATLVVAVAFSAVQRFGARWTAGGSGTGIFFGLQLLGVAGVFVEVLVGASALRAAVGVVGAETFFGWISVSACAGWVGGATARGGVACAWVGGWRARWRTGGGGVDRGGGTFPGGLFCVDVYVEPVRVVSE